MNVEPDGMLKWITIKETGKLTYVIEQFRWNKWVKVGEVEGNGTTSENNYSFKVTPHSGENQFRVKQVDYTSQPRYSKPIKFQSTAAVVETINLRVKDNLEFTGETMFEIYDKFGNIVKKGYGQKVDLTSLVKDVYYLNYDNKTTEFIKSK